MCPQANRTKVILLLTVILALLAITGCDSLKGVTSTQIEVNGTKYNVTVADNTTTTPTEKEKTKTTITPKVENDELGRSGLSIEPQVLHNGGRDSLRNKL